MAETNYNNGVHLDGEVCIPEPEFIAVTQDQKEWVDLHRDCDIFGSLTDALYGPDMRSSAEGNFKCMPRADYLGLCGTLKPPLRYASTPMRCARDWPSPEIAAHPFQTSTNQALGSTSSIQQWHEQLAVPNSPEGLQPGFQSPSTTARASTRSAFSPYPRQPTFQTPILTPHSSNESSVLDSLLDTPTPAPRENRNWPRFSADLEALHTNAASPSHSSNISVFVPASSITSLNLHDPDPPPMGLLRSHDMNRDRYNWITPQLRMRIHGQVNSIWMATRNPAVTHDTKERLLGNLWIISNQVHDNERKHRIQFHWLPRILQWLQARQHFPQGSNQYQRATSDLSSVRGLLSPDEVAYVQQTIQARTQAAAQGHDRF